MAQHDYVISNGTGAAVRSDLNNALLAIVSQNSGATEPTTTYAYQWWADTTTGLLKIRNSANNAWITLRELDGTLTIEDGTVSAPGLAFRDDLNTGIWRPGTDQFAISTNGVERVEWGTSEVVFNDGGTNYDFRVEGDNNANLLFVDASADAIGIGTASPLSNLVVSNGSNKNIEFQPGSTSYLLAYDRTAGDYLDLDIAGQIVRFSTDNGSERARLTASGQWLVGTSTGTNNIRLDQKIAVVSTGGNFAGAALTSYGGTSASVRPVLDFNRSRGTTDGSMTAVAADDFLGTIVFRGSDGTQFLDGAFVQALVDGSVSTNDLPTRLVFSTTADGTSSPTERMRLAQDGRFNLFNSGSATAILQTASAAGTTNTIIAGRYNATNNNSGSDCFYVFSNGNVQNTNNSYTAISDIKLKENIVDASSQWDDIKAFQVRNYNLKEGQTHKQIGLIAQEVEPISPGLVYESPDRDADGNDLGTVTKSVNYSVLYMKAVKALQEAMERIETLEAKVAALESA